MEQQEKKRCRLEGGETRFVLAGVMAERSEEKTLNTSDYSYFSRFFFHRASESSKQSAASPSLCCPSQPPGAVDEVLQP